MASFADCRNAGQRTFRNMNTGIDQYYHSRAIIQRILEFIGVPSSLLSKLTIKSSAPLADSAKLKELLCSATAEYVAAYGKKLMEILQKDHTSMKDADLGWALDNALDIHRSVWDEKYILGTLDVEYFSKDFRAEAYLNYERVFSLLEPVYIAITEVLATYGISPLVITTGQGYNFDVQVTKKSTVFKELVELGHIETTLLQDYSQPSAQSGRPVPEADARAFDAMGKLMEFLCHKIFTHLSGSSLPIPLVIGDIVCGNEKREAVSLDLSLYTHPVQKRSIRCPFSTYAKHKLAGEIQGYIAAESIGCFFCVPRRTPDAELSLADILDMRRSEKKAIRQAGRVSTSIPEQHKGFSNLLAEYKSSVLFDFHREFDAVEQDDTYTWPQGYDSFDLESVPPCIAQAFRCPNPLLLQPTNLRAIVGVLMAIGWHPKHIAGMIYSKYMRDYGWEVDFGRYNANRWANVWVRIYAGMILCNIDGLLDINCTSQQEKGEAWMGMQYCPSPGCGFNLADYRAALEKRIDR